MKKLFKFILVVAVTFCAAACCNQKQLVETSLPHKIVDGKIVIEVPKRAPGQTTALEMTCPAMDTVRVGFIGLGMRGSGAVYRYTFIDGVKITAVCDLEADRVAKAQNTLANRNFPAAKEYVGEDSWKKLCESDDVDLIYLCTPWQMHTEMAVYAMECGKHVAIEVPAALSIKECWQLVDTSEKTRKHCMMLENCVYDFFEMTALNMAQLGLFGEILHVEGAYIHNLDPYWTAYHNNWRLDHNSKQRGDVYPTHGLGPVCQVLNIHRGDKMDYLVAMDTKSVHGQKLGKELMGIDDFKNGDHSVTLIRTANGKQIEIQHNVFTRRPYNRLYSISGVDGYACKYPMQGFALKTENLAQAGSNYENLDGERFVSDEIRQELMEKYKHPITAEIEEQAKKVGGHGGMDFIMDYRLIYCLRNGLPLDQDVYDAAEWSCLTELSGLSMDYGSMPVEVPDFTRGDWKKVNGLKLHTK
jgi:predicted dehydrogenase